MTGPPVWTNPGAYGPVSTQAMRRRRARAIMLVLVLVVGVVAAQIARSGGNGFPPNQAGYIYCCTVDQIAATWTVPTLVHSDSEGFYSEWVGTQDVNATILVQVGTTSWSEPPGMVTEAFWSDTAVNYSPISLGIVRPGDVVRASIDYRGKEVLVGIDDVTARWNQTITLSQIPSDATQTGEFVQEDPAVTELGGRKALEPFGEVGAASMSRLDVNDKPPSPISLQPESVTIGKTTYQPSPLRNDGFSFSPW